MQSRSEFGKAAETYVAKQLESQGYVIVERNARIGRLELDIVAKKASLLVFCEVRARSNTDFMDPEQSIDEKKIERIRRAAALWLQSRKLHDYRSIRFDVAAVTRKKDGFELRYYDSAF